MTLVDDLKAARALIDTPEKWVKGEFEANGCFCILGALGSVAELNTRFSFANPRSRQAYNVLASSLPDPRGAVSTFNDAPPRHNPRRCHGPVRTRHQLPSLPSSKGLRPNENVSDHCSRG